jgi:hypothetical protein
LRQCKTNEPKGLVISTYLGFGGETDYEWLAVPISNYLYGVDHSKQVPLYSNNKIHELLRESNRAKFLGTLIPRSPSEKLPKGRWTELFGAALSRDLYAFTVKTTAEQDLRFLSEFNIAPTGSSFNLLTSNCADFAKGVINLYFPSAVSRDFINDFGVTTPKALAHSFTKYATKDPKLRFHIDKVSQLDGTIARSTDLQHFTEKAFKSKKYVAIQALTMPVLIPVFAGTYFLTGGHFNIDKAYRKYPSARFAELSRETKSNPKSIVKIEMVSGIRPTRLSEKQRIFGETAVWKNYRQKFAEILATAYEDGLFANKNEFNMFFSDLEVNSEPVYDENGDLMLRVKTDGKELYLGLTRRNITGSDSSARLAYKLMLVKLRYALNAPEKNRETMEVFRANWELSAQLSEMAGNEEPGETLNHPQFAIQSNGPPAGKKLQRLIQRITN